MQTRRANGPAIRVIRQRSGVKVRALQASLADLGLRVHEDHLRNIETGSKDASPELLAGIARVLGVPLPAVSNAERVDQAS